MVIARNQVVGIVAAVVLIVAAITGVLLVGEGGTHSSPEKVVRSYMIAVYEEGDASQYLGLIYPEDVDQLEAQYGIGKDEIQVGLQDSLDGFHSQLASEGASLTWAVGNTTAQNATAETTVTLKFSHPVYGDEEHTEKVPTLEREGRWYLKAELLESFLQWFVSLQE